MLPNSFLASIVIKLDMKRQSSDHRLKVSATLKIAIFPYLRFQRFQIDMLQSFLLKKKLEKKYYFCRKISGVKDFFSLIILIDR